MTLRVSPLQRSIYRGSNPVDVSMQEHFGIARIGSLIKELEQTKEELENMKRNHEEEHRANLEYIADTLRNVLKIQKGDKGDAGESIEHEKVVSDVLDKIEKPKDGINGRDGKDGRDGKTPTIDYDALAKRVQSMIRKPKDGKDGASVLIEDVIAHIKKEKILNIEHIGGLSESIRSMSSQLAGKVYGRDTLVRGGGDTVAAGSGISINNTNGVKTISVSTVGMIILTATGTVDDSNTSFTFTQKPTLVNINGTFYRESHGWSWTDGTLTATVDAPVGEGGDIYGIA